MKGDNSIYRGCQLTDITVHGQSSHLEVCMYSYVGHAMSTLGQLVDPWQ